MQNQFQQCLKNLTIILENEKYLVKVDNPTFPRKENTQVQMNYETNHQQY